MLLGVSPSVGAQEPPAVAPESATPGTEESAPDPTEPTPDPGYEAMPALPPIEGRSWRPVPGFAEPAFRQPVRRRPMGVPEVTLRALSGRLVALALRDGQTISGRILSCTMGIATLVSGPHSEVLSVRIMDVAGVRLLPELPPPEPPSLPERPRYVGVHIGLTPAVMVDLQWRYLYAFANASVVFPLAKLAMAFSGGLGASLPLSNKHWRFDLFVFAAPLKFFDPYERPAVGIGLGAGFHYTYDNGFTLGFKLPLAGYAAGPGMGNPSSGVAAFYLSSVMGLPLFDFGYRF